MTALLEKAVAKAKTLPFELQDEIARMVLIMASENQSLIEISSDEQASLALSLDQAMRREFATDEQISAIWSKYES